MTESGDPKDNAQTERINNTMKNELLKDKVFNTIEEVITAIALAVDFYNNRRPHMSVGMMTPSEAAESTGERDMKWTSYRHLAIKNRAYPVVLSWLDIAMTVAGVSLIGYIVALLQVFSFMKKEDR